MDIDTLKIETPRLILRPPCWEDFDAWAAFLADEGARGCGGCLKVIASIEEPALIERILAHR